MSFRGAYRGHGTPGSQGRRTLAGATALGAFTRSVRLTSATEHYAAINAQTIDPAASMIVTPPESLTNYVTYSKDCTGAHWAARGTGTWSASVGVADDGTTTLGQYTGDATGNDYEWAGANWTPSTAGQYTLSALVRAGDSNLCTLKFFQATGGESAQTHFVFSTETFYSTASVDATGYEDLGNGLYRIWMEKTLDATNEAIVRLGRYSALQGAPTLTGTYCYFGSVQVREGAGDPGPFVETTTAAAAVDDPLIGVSASANWILPQEITTAGAFTVDEFTDVIDYQSGASGIGTVVSSAINGAELRVPLPASTGNIVVMSEIDALVYLGNSTVTLPTSPRVVHKGMAYQIRPLTATHVAFERANTGESGRIAFCGTA